MMRGTAMVLIAVLLGEGCRRSVPDACSSDNFVVAEEWDQRRRAWNPLNSDLVRSVVRDGSATPTQLAMKGRLYAELRLCMNQDRGTCIQMYLFQEPPIIALVCDGKHYYYNIRPETYRQLRDHIDGARALAAKQSGV
jgi:hypothetical protein